MRSELRRRAGTPVTRSTYMITPGSRAHPTDELSTAVDEAHADLVITDGGLNLPQGRLLEDKVGARSWIAPRS
jgi:hypothetical protein